MDRISEAVSQLRIIDGHEHIDMLEVRQQRQTDFFKTIHYLESDLVTAGMERNILFSPELNSKEKTNIFLKYWPKVKNTTYARVVDVYARDLYGLEEWSTQEVLKMNQCVIEKTADENWFREVLYEKAKIDMIITLAETTKVDRTLFRPVLFLDYLFRVFSKSDIFQLEKRYKKSVSTLESYLELIDQILETLVNQGVVAIKLGHAYWRTLEMKSGTDYEKAQLSFNNLLFDEPTAEEVTEFQDFIIYYLIGKATFYHLPIQIHTGHHETSVSQDGNTITNSKVTGLLPLLKSFPEAKFVLLHNGFPYHQEYLSIAKNYPNTYVDFTWMYVISDSLGKKLLHQTMDMIPANKILGFGGDFNSVEGSYAHQKIARKLIIEVLQERCRDGKSSEEEAIELATMILRENYLELYELGEDNEKCIESRETVSSFKQ